MVFMSYLMSIHKASKKVLFRVSLSNIGPKDGLEFCTFKSSLAPSKSYEPTRFSKSKCAIFFKMCIKSRRWLIFKFFQYSKLSQHEIKGATDSFPLTALWFASSSSLVASSTSWYINILAFNLKYRFIGVISIQKWFSTFPSKRLVNPLDCNVCPMSKKSLSQTYTSFQDLFY